MIMIITDVQDVLFDKIDEITPQSRERRLVVLVKQCCEFSVLLLLVIPPSQMVFFISGLCSAPFFPSSPSTIF